MFKPLTIISLITLLVSPISATELEDPMAPLATSSGARVVSADRSPKLSAIIIGEHRRVAVINDEPFLIGYHVSGYQITAIEAHSIEISRGGTTRTLRLGTELVENDDAS